MEDALEFYERRAREESRAVESCSSAAAASVHRMLAIEYEAQAHELRNRQQERPKPKLRSV